jgi:hypothetical protein
MNGMLFVMDPCPECVRLKRAYAHVIAEHIRLAGQQHIAHLQGDYEREKTISVEAEQANEARQAARQEIADHEAAAHTTSGANPDSTS